jgi:pilus assembly protein Flp/PilA
MMNLVLMGLNRLHKDEAGQGLVEYLLILALVAFAATAGMNNLATGLNSAFTRISQILGSYIT